jgi:hypothetical protein
MQIKETRKAQAKRRFIQVGSDKETAKAKLKQQRSVLHSSSG